MPSMGRIKPCTEGSLAPHQDKQALCRKDGLSFGSSLNSILPGHLIVRANMLLTQLELPDRETHQSFGARDSLLRMTHPRGCGCYQRRMIFPPHPL